MATLTNVTGDPRWQLAREIVAQLRTMPGATAEAECDTRLWSILGYLFPNLNYPEIAVQYPSGDGPIDVYCRNVVFEAKKQGKTQDVRIKSDGSTETPQEQAIRYLNALTQRPTLFDDSDISWRACVTDGKEWSFYSYDRGQNSLTLLHELRLTSLESDDVLLSYLYDFVNRTAKLPPPTGDQTWADDLAAPFVKLAEDYQDTVGYQIKISLWRDLLRGAFITPPNDPKAERDLFARHTMLVVVARAVAETLWHNDLIPVDSSALHESLAKGFAAWLLDAADTDGEQTLDNLLAEVNRFDWSLAGRDTLKDLYHVIIPANIRHDFGEYYTPDWLARAVCEEVLDPEWRKETVDLAVSGGLEGPAVLDPSCGSGTFLYHATQLLLDEAATHAALKDSPEAQVEVVNGLVAGIDLHPVAVELAKTTKMSAFSSLA